MLTVRPLTFGTSRGLTPAGSVLLPYGGSFSKGANVVIWAGAAEDAIAPLPSAEALARNARLDSPGVAVPFMVPPCASSRREDPRALPQLRPGLPTRVTPPTSLVWHRS